MSFSGTSMTRRYGGKKMFYRGGLMKKQSKEEDLPKTLKLVLVGDSGCGKTSLATVFR